MRFVRDSLLIAAVAAALVSPAAARAATAEQIIRDCSQDGDFDRQYSQRDLRKAEGRLPTDVDEYTDCRDVINQAQIRDRGSRAGQGGGAGGGTGGSGPGGSVAASAKDATALTRRAKAAGKGDAPPLSVGGERVKPGGGGLLSTASSANELPLPLLIALLCVAAVSVAAGYAFMRRRFAEAGRAALRLFRR